MVAPLPTWVEIDPGYNVAPRGPLACEVVLSMRGGYRWAFGVRNKHGQVTAALGKSGPMLDDLLPIDEAKRACWTAAGEYGAAIVEGREVRRG